MQIETLSINSVRNIERATILPDPGCNLIFGHNGAGKSSVLEAISLAATAKSFRTGNPNQYTSYDSRFFKVEVGAITGSNRRLTSSVQRKDSVRSVFLNGKRVSSSSQLAKDFPLLVFSHETFSSRSTSSDARRSLLDWYLFHVKPSHGTLLKSYRQALNQYRYVIEGGGADAELWVSQLAGLAEQIDRHRQSLVEELNKKFKEMISPFSSLSDTRVSYRRGWSEGIDLSTLLHQSEHLHRKLGYVNIGPHRADLQIRGRHGDVKTWCSRGQLKAVHFVLLVSLIALFQLRKTEPPVLLLDDLWAEIDRGTGTRLISLLKPLNLQVFVSALEDFSSAISFMNPVMFHVEHGCISKAK